MNCPYCGEKIEPPNQKVCPFCGTKLDIPSGNSQQKQDYNLGDLMQMVSSHSTQEPYQPDRHYSASHETLSKQGNQRFFCYIKLIFPLYTQNSNIV